MAKKLPVERDVIAAPPVEAVDPIQNADGVILDGKAAIYSGPSMFEINPVPGRDGSGPYKVVTGGVLLPDGAYAPVGATIDPAAEGCSPAAIDDWLRRGMVVPVKQTKEFKGEIITKG